MNYNNDKFILSSKIKKFILDSDDLLQNIPRYDFYNRDRFRNDITEILYLVYLANIIQDKDLRKNYQYDICARLSMIDFYLERAYVLKYISQKQLYTFTNKLEELIKITKGWMKSNEWCGIYWCIKYI